MSLHYELRIFKVAMHDMLGCATSCPCDEGCRCKRQMSLCIFIKKIMSLSVVLFLFSVNIQRCLRPAARMTLESGTQKLHWNSSALLFPISRVPAYSLHVMENLSLVVSVV